MQFEKSLAKHEVKTHYKVTSSDEMMVVSGQNTSGYGADTHVSKVFMSSTLHDATRFTNKEVALKIAEHVGGKVFKFTTTEIVTVLREEIIS